MQKKINLKKVEKNLGLKLNSNTISIGFDVSVHSKGIALIKTTEKSLIIEKIDKIVTPKNIAQLSALDAFISQLDNFKDKVIQKYKLNVSIIEDCFMGQNVNTLKALARHSALVYDRFKRISDNVELLLPTQARKIIGFKKSDKKIKGSALKREIIEFVNNILNTEYKPKDNDIVDALILALAGLIA